MKIIRLSAKCSDLFSATLTENDVAVGSYSGYVPDCIPNDWGDYVTLDIDIDTGKILNWVIPSKKTLTKYFKTDSDRE